MERPIYVPMFEDMLLALDCLDDGELRKALDMIRAYYFDGQEPPEDRSPARAIFLGFKASMDKTLARSKANARNARRKARQDESEPSANEKRSRSQILANASEPPAKPERTSSETERNGAKAKRTEAKALPATHPNASETERNGSEPVANEQRNEAKPHKTKDQGPKNKDQEKVKSVARARKPPRPLSKFEPPSVEEADAYAEAYAASKGLKIADLKWDAERFVDHFTANGWKVSGKAPMRDWHASVRNWMKNDNPQLEGGAKADGWADQYVPEAIVVD